MASHRNLQGDEMTDDAIEITDANASWQPIYVTIILTAAQCVVFLMIYECSRRSDRVGGVFERRRQKYPSLTPPPLMQKRGCVKGWLAFEWWRVKVADENYRNMSLDEWRNRERDQLNRQECRRKTKRRLSKAVDESFAREAAEHCYERSPFFDPTTRTADLQAEETTGDQDMKFVPKVKNTAGGEPTRGLALETVETSNATTPEPSIDPPISQRKVPRSLSGRPQSILQPLSTESAPARKSDVEVDGNVPLRVSQSEIGPSGMTLLPLADGGSEGNFHRHVHFGRSDSDVYAVDAPMDPKEAERFAELRRQERETRKWDLRIISTLTKFVKTRVLMLRDKPDDAGPCVQNGNTDEPSAQQFIAAKIHRRPLTDVQIELLRCIGLDAFMTLRFLAFCFDVSLWPLLFSVVTLLPVFKTGEADVDGFFSWTALGLADGSPHFWMVVIFGFVQYCYILRRLWIEWELFIPLRYDFLENGDFQNEKYMEQFRKTCLVEYVPRSHRHDKTLHEFFDEIFPGQVRRAEVLLNTEYLRSLIRERMKHIIAYEDTYAKKVHTRADYMRDLDAVKNGSAIKKCCKTIAAPREPREPKIIVVHKISREEMGNLFIGPPSLMVRDARTHSALAWHHHMIQKLNKDIDDEFLRIAQERRHPVTQKKESRLAKWLGLEYLNGAEMGGLHSCTAFVEFRSLTTKQQAIQCNITGANNFISVMPVPEIRGMIWDNAHVSRSLIETRRRWADLALFGGLIAWSFLVSVIRSYDNLSSDLNFDYENQPFMSTLLDTYFPVMVVEGLVRGVPFAVRGICGWIRFKTEPEIDHYVLLWYFWYRLLAFMFVLIGGSIIDSSQDLIDDPVGFLQSLSDNIMRQAQFFISYVIFTGGFYIFYELSQFHNILMFWFVFKITREEAVSQRKLQKMRTTTKLFYIYEFIPLFIFIFLVSALYGSLVPLANIFVACFFKISYKVFKYMALFAYGTQYQGGGFLFYTYTTMFFFVLYLIILMIFGYLSSHGSPVMAGIFSIVLFIVLVVHVAFYRTFVVPSKTLSLTKARLSDEKRDRITPQERKLEQYLQVKAELKEIEERGGGTRRRLSRNLSTRPAYQMEGEDEEAAEQFQTSTESERIKQAVKRLEQRYQEVETISDITESDRSGPRPDFFIYRQPSLNRATWELAPQPYRDTVNRVEDVEIWG